MGKGRGFTHLLAVAVFSVPVVFMNICMAEGSGSSKQTPKSPVQVGKVLKQMVTDQITLIGTTQPVAESIVATEVAGIVKRFPVKEGDYVPKGALLVELKSTYLKMRLKALWAAKEKTRSNLKYAQKELMRVTKLKETNSVAQKAYDHAFADHQSLSQELQRNNAEIDQLDYEVSQTKVKAPFGGFISKEHTQIGQWLNAGGPVVNLIDLGMVLVTVDVPERYAVKLSTEADIDIFIRSVSEKRLAGRFSALLPQGNPAARTFPVRIRIENPKLAIKSGMEAMVTFNLEGKREVLLVPKDAIVGFGEAQQVFTVVDGRAKPVMVEVLGYYGNSVAVDGDLKPGESIVIRGNERLRPGQNLIIQP